MSPKTVLLFVVGLYFLICQTNVVEAQMGIEGEGDLSSSIQQILAQARRMNDNEDDEEGQESGHGFSSTNSKGMCITIKLYLFCTFVSKLSLYNYRSK